jgi:hypothetical protein
VKKVLVGSSALALVLVAGFFAATTGGSAPRKDSPAPSTTTSTAAGRAVHNSTTTTTVVPTTTTTTTVKPKPVDPVAGAVALRLQDRSIDAIGANGKVVKHLVTTFADRVVVSAHLLGDHHTIWYETVPTGTKPSNRCNDVVRLDLATNRRTVIAHANSFSVSGDGLRVALTDVPPDGVCTGSAQSVPGNNFVRDLVTGKQSPVVGSLEGPLVLSPGGHVLVTTECTSDEYDCSISLATAAMPSSLGSPITPHLVAGDKTEFFGLIPGSDALYAFVNPSPDGCTCTGSPKDTQQIVRRFSWSDLGGTGTQVIATDGSDVIQSIVGSTGSLYATTVGGTGSNPTLTFNRIVNNQVVGLEKLPAGATISLGAIDPFFG